VVIYAIDHAGASATEVGVLLAVEMAVAMAVYLPVAHLAGRYGKEPFVIATFFFFTVFPLALLYARTFETLLLAFVIRGLKEFGDSPRKALIIEYAPADSRGRAIGAYYLARDLIVSAGALLGAALWKLGPAVNFGSAAALGALGTLFYIGTLPKDR
jgi:MFS family permease